MGRQGRRDALVTGLVTDTSAIINALPVVGLEEGQSGWSRCWRWSPTKRSSQAKAGTWRIARAVARDRIVSTVHPESRQAHKSGSS
ncbi:MAG: hypothetical protein ACRD0K_18105 [Egibacteraceae bacterium]